MPLINLTIEEHQSLTKLLCHPKTMAYRSDLYDTDTFEEVAKDYPIVLEDTDGWTEEDFADYRKETFIDINNTGGKY